MPSAYISYRSPQWDPVSENAQGNRGVGFKNVTEVICVCAASAESKAARSGSSRGFRRDSSGFVSQSLALGSLSGLVKFRVGLITHHATCYVKVQTSLPCAYQGAKGDCPFHFHHNGDDAVFAAAICCSCHTSGHCRLGSRNLTKIVCGRSADSVIMGSSSSEGLSGIPPTTWSRSSVFSNLSLEIFFASPDGPPWHEDGSHFNGTAVDKYDSAMFL